MRIKATVEYCGTPYSGWQIQEAGVKSIQGSIEKAILSMTGIDVSVCAAGRTDAGVHALGQVIHFDLSGDFSPYQLREGINFHLQQEAVRIVDLQFVPVHFHARFDAQKRFYRYKILRRSVMSPLWNERVWHYKWDLDIAAMRVAAKLLEGPHDFTSFRAKECQAKSPVKTLDHVIIRCDGDMIDIDFQARSFLHHQVRNMVGTLVWVGAGKFQAQDVIQILEARDRSQAGPTAPACGLYFVGVEYVDELATGY